MNSYSHDLIRFVAALAFLSSGVLSQGVAAASTNADPPCFDNDNRYVDCRNGTITDTVTGLIWLKQADCLEAKDYAAANRVAATLQERRCGLRDGSSKGDWRLPTEAEWRTTLSPLSGLESTLFTGVQAALYWSSSTNADRPDTAWAADFQAGTVLTETKSSVHYGWPVRGHLTASAMPASQSSEIRDQVISGLSLASLVRMAVAEYFQTTGKVPSGLEEVYPNPISGSYVKSVEISSGRIDITYGNGANTQITGKVLSLTLYSDRSIVEWRCGRAPEPQFPLVSNPDATTVDNLYLPAQCQP